MGSRLAWFAAFLGLVGSGCEGRYRGAPTPCDDYCFALQRADCAADWPHECVSQCERARSPVRYPECRNQFDTLVECLDGAPDDDFVCVLDRSEPRQNVCGFEIKSLDFCTEPVFYRCLEFCETRGARCPNVDANVCSRSCTNVPPACENQAVRWLECELSEERACSDTPRCVPLLEELGTCIWEARATDAG